MYGRPLTQRRRFSGEPAPHSCIRERVRESPTEMVCWSNHARFNVPRHQRQSQREAFVPLAPLLARRHVARATDTLLAFSAAVTVEQYGETCRRHAVGLQPRVFVTLV